MMLGKLWYLNRFVFDKVKKILVDINSWCVFNVSALKLKEFF